MNNNSPKIHIDEKLKNDIKKDAAMLSKQGNSLTMSDIIKFQREATKRLKKEKPEVYREVVAGIFG